VFEGTESFGQSALNITDHDGRVRVQLHDLYGMLGGTTTGRGGRARAYNGILFPNGGLGGRVGTNEFDLNIAGYVVIAHTNQFLDDPLALEEVLCHEIGHVLSMDHSSEDPSETDLELREALMYYRMHNDGRGAHLSTWDVHVVQQAHPPGNTPPYGYHRVIHAITADPQYTPTTGVNRIDIRAYDRQQAAFSLSITNATTRMGFFLLEQGHLSYFPTNLWGDASLDPGLSSFYDRCDLRISDGTNRSPPVAVRVVSFGLDWPDRDGLPDQWATLHGVTNASADPDLDGFPNLVEWLIDTGPTDADSGLRFLSFEDEAVTWHARGYEVYELWAATNVAGPYSLDMNPVTPTNAEGSAQVDVLPGEAKFFRVRRLP